MVEPVPNASLTRNSFWPRVRDLTRYLGLGLNSACSSGEHQETVQGSQSQDIARRHLKDTAAVAEGIEQDLSNGFIDLALVEAAHGESASLEGSRDNSSCPGGTNCTSWECVPSTGDSARELPSVKTIDARDAYFHATEGHVDQVSRGIYASIPSQVGQLGDNRLELVPCPLHL